MITLCDLQLDGDRQSEVHWYHDLEAGSASITGRQAGLLVSEMLRSGGMPSPPMSKPLADQQALQDELVSKAFNGQSGRAL